MKLQRLIVMGVALAIMGSAMVAQGEDKPVFQYTGVAKCKRCHSSEKKGNQYKSWMESKHASAWLDLASAKAKEVAKAKNIADPQKAPECLECHVTGAGEPADHFVVARADSEGVGCESCHGAGGSYYKLAVMKDARAKKIEPASVGLVVPDKAVCAKCHNERSTGGKTFDFDAYHAKISHKIPPGAETAE